MAETDDLGFIQDEPDDIGFVPEADSSFSPAAALEGYGQATTLGYLPHLQALADKVVTPIGNLITGAEVEAEDYVTARDKNIKRSEKLAEENPLSYAAGFVPGAVATGMATQPLAAARGASALARIATAGGTGAAMGAIANPGDKEGEIQPLQLEDRAKNAGVGLAIGAGLQGAGEVIKSTAKAARRLSNEKAVKAVGAIQKDMKKLDPKKVQEMGEQFFEEGIVTPLARPKVIAQRISDKIDEYSTQLDDLIKRADDTLDRPEGWNMETATPEQIRAAISGKVRTSDLKNQVIADIRSQFDGVPEEKIAPALQEVEIWFRDKDEFMPIKDMQKLKTSLNTFIKKTSWTKDQNPMSQEGMMAVRRGAKEGIETATDSAAKILGDSDGQIKNLNRRFGNILQADDLAADAIARDAGNHTISLRDAAYGGGGGTAAGATIGSMIAGPVGGLIGGAAGTAIGTGASKTIRSFGDPLAATGLRAASKVLDSSQNIPLRTASIPIVSELLRSNEEVPMTFPAPDSPPMMATSPILEQSRLQAPPPETNIERAKRLNQMNQGM